MIAPGTVLLLAGCVLLAAACKRDSREGTPAAADSVQGPVAPISPLPDDSSGLLLADSVQGPVTLSLLEERSNGSEYTTCLYEIIRVRGERRLLEDPECTAQLAPGGRYVALQSHGSDGGLILYDVERDVYEVAVTFLAGTDVGPFVWSPSGDAIAFTTVNQGAADYPTQSKLFIYDVVRRSKIKVNVHAFEMCGAACYASLPRWSPDGQRILLVEVDRDRMLAGADVYQRDAVFDRTGRRLETSAWRSPLP